MYRICYWYFGDFVMFVVYLMMVFWLLWLIVFFKKLKLCIILVLKRNNVFSLMMKINYFFYLVILNILVKIEICIYE